jgi:hypothetical protein
MWKSAAKVTLFQILTTLTNSFLSDVPDWLTKAAATKPPQEGDTPTPQPLADRQPSESI